MTETPWPVIEEQLDEMGAFIKSTVEHLMSPEKVIEDVEVEPAGQELRRGRADEEEYDQHEPKSFDPDIGLQVVQISRTNSI